MDERYTERQKIAMRKKRKQRKRKRIFVLVCFIVSCIAILTVVFKAPFFNITKVEVEGYKILTQKQILDKAKITVGENIFSHRMSGVRERIMELSYASDVEVKRVFPSRIKITIKECKPRAYIAYNKKFALIDYSGKILEMPKTNDKYKVMTIKGIEIKSPAVGEYIKNEKDERIKNCIDALTILEENEMIEKVRQIDFKKLTGIKINYDDRVYVNCGSFGNYDDFKYKLSVCAHLIDEEISPYEKVEVDLTMEETIVRPYIDDETKARLQEEKKKLKEEEKALEEKKAEETTEENKND